MATPVQTLLELEITCHKDAKTAEQLDNDDFLDNTQFSTEIKKVIVILRNQFDYDHTVTTSNLDSDSTIGGELATFLDSWVETQKFGVWCKATLLVDMCDAEDDTPVIDASHLVLTNDKDHVVVRLEAHQKSATIRFRNHIDADYSKACRYRNLSNTHQATEILESSTKADIYLAHLTLMPVIEFDYPRTQTAITYLLDQFLEIRNGKRQTKELNDSRPMLENASNHKCDFCGTGNWSDGIWHKDMNLNIDLCANCAQLPSGQALIAKHQLIFHKKDSHAKPSDEFYDVYSIRMQPSESGELDGLVTIRYCDGTRQIACYQEGNRHGDGVNGNEKTGEEQWTMYCRGHQLADEHNEWNMGGICMRSMRVLWLQGMIGHSGNPKYLIPDRLVTESRMSSSRSQRLPTDNNRESRGIPLLIESEFENESHHQ